MFQSRLPPVTSTLPSAITVEVASRRWRCIDAVVLTLGVLPLTSMTMAPFELPPICRMRPGWNITAVESLPVVAAANCPAIVMLPLPLVLTQYMRPALSKPNRRPSGAMKLRGYMKSSVLVLTPLSRR